MVFERGASGVPGVSQRAGAAVGYPPGVTVRGRPRRVLYLVSCAAGHTLCRCAAVTVWRVAGMHGSARWGVGLGRQRQRGQDLGPMCPIWLPFVPLGRLGRRRCAGSGTEEH